MTELREIKIGGDRPRPPTVNLRDFGFVYRVSPQALAEIEAAERRAALVITTANRYWFR